MNPQGISPGAFQEHWITNYPIPPDNAIKNTTINIRPTKMPITIKLLDGFLSQ